MTSYPGKDTMDDVDPKDLKIEEQPLLNAGIASALGRLFEHYAVQLPQALVNFK